MQVTVVDFTVTMAGLEDQLLGKLILKEKHELEEQRQQLMEEVQSYKKKIKQLEDDLLFRLSNRWGVREGREGTRPELQPVLCARMCFTLCLPSSARSHAVRVH